MNIEEATEMLKRIYVTEFNTSSIYDNVPNVNLAIETLLTAYEKEKAKNKSLEQENSFLKMMYRGTDEFKAIENLAKGE